MSPVIGKEYPVLLLLGVAVIAMYVTFMAGIEDGLDQANDKLLLYKSHEYCVKHRWTADMCQKAIDNALGE